TANRLRRRVRLIHVMRPPTLSHPGRHAPPTPRRKRAGRPPGSDGPRHAALAAVFCRPMPVVRLADLIDQPAAAEFLRGVVAGGRFANAYLFHRPPGVDKGTAPLAF